MTRRASSIRLEVPVFRSRLETWEDTVFLLITRLDGRVGRCDRRMLSAQALWLPQVSTVPVCVEGDGGADGPGLYPVRDGNGLEFAVPNCVQLGVTAK